MCIMFAERLNDSRGDLVANMQVNELLLSCMMEKSIISLAQKKEIQRVCTPSVLVFFMMLLCIRMLIITHRLIKTKKCNDFHFVPLYD